MEEVSHTEARQHYSKLQAALTRWEGNPGREAFALHDAIKETKTQLAAWDAAQVYPGHDVRQLRDLAACAEALMTQAAQVKARGY